MILFYLQKLKEGMQLEMGKEIIAEIGKKNGLEFPFIASLVDEYESDHILKTINENLKKSNH